MIIPFDVKSKKHVYSDGLLGVLDKVNRDINHDHRYKTDLELYGKKDFWNILEAGAQGDCEDYALTKRAKLLELGFNKLGMSMATCWVEPPTQEYHAVLIVHTTKKDFVLDNRQEHAVDWRIPGYIYHKVQNLGTNSWGLVKTNYESG